MAAVFKAGSQAGAGTVDFDFHTFLVKLLNAEASEATVKINGQTVVLPASMSNYENFPVDVEHIEVVTGTVDYVAIG